MILLCVDGSDRNIVMKRTTDCLNSTRLYSLIIMHAVPRVNAEDISASLRTSPIEIPIVIGRHLNPSTLFKVVEQN